MKLSGGAAGRSRNRVSSSGVKQGAHRARRQRRTVAISLFASYRPHARQLALHRDRAPRIIVNAGRRSGKTHGLGHAFMGRVFEDYERARREVALGRRLRWARPKKLMRETTPFLKYWVVAPTYDLVAGCARVIFDILGGTSGELVLKYDQTTRQLWLRGGILIEFKSGERPERLVGVGLDGAWLDEAARLKPTVWYDSVEPTLAEFGGWAYLSSTPLGQNFFFDLFQRTQLTTEPKKKLSGWSGHHFRTIDNTAMPLLVAAAKAAKLALPEAYYRRNYEADFYSFEGKIYELFIDSTPHVVDELPGSYVRMVAGLDWGWKNPGVITVVGFTGEDAAYVIAEEYASGVHVAPPPGAREDAEFDSWCARAVKWARQGVEVIYCDPSEPEHIATLRRAMKAAGVRCRVQQAKNAVTPGVDLVGAMFASTPGPGGHPEPSLYLHRSCVNTRRELVSYRWADGGDRPVKVDDHACDALRYALYSESKLNPRRFARTNQLNLDLFAATA